MSDSDAAALSDLIEASWQRLATAQKVARYKAEFGVAVEDLAREQAVLTAAGGLAPSFGLEPDDARRFFVHQIEANKWIQYSLLADWSVAGSLPAEPVVDLATEVRPELDRLQLELLDALSRVAAVRTLSVCAHLLNQGIYAFAEAEALDFVQRAALVRSLASVCA